MNKINIQFASGEKKKIKDLLNAALGEPENKEWSFTISVMGCTDTITVEDSGGSRLHISADKGGNGMQAIKALANKLNNSFKIKKYGFGEGYLEKGEQSDNDLVACHDEIENLKAQKVGAEPAQKHKLNKEIGYYNQISEGLDSKLSEILGL